MRIFDLFLALVILAHMAAFSCSLHNVAEHDPENDALPRGSSEADASLFPKFRLYKPVIER